TQYPAKLAGSLALCSSRAHACISTHARTSTWSSLDEVKLLEGAPQNGLGVQAHPLLQQRRVGAAEGVVPLQVAVVQLLRLQGRILAVQATFDRIADHKSHAARAVVRA